MKEKILIVEDIFVEANNLEMILSKAGHPVCTIARDVPAALTILEEERPDLVLLDIFLKGPLTGIDLAAILNEKRIAFVYLSANSNKQTLDAAKSTQPYGFLVKPFREKDVLVALEIAHYLHTNRPVLPGVVSGDADPAGGKASDGFKDIVGKSKGLIEVLKQIRVVAPTETSVLVLGESGTGKEKVAEAIHRLSPRKNRPFIKVNCAALTSTLVESELFGHERGAFTDALERRIGKFEQADGGTIFLDEIGELPAATQLKFLRVLQEREISRLGGNRTIRTDVRVIAATNRDLEKEMAEGRFRIDLYYRLHVFPLVVPPLRERKEDIPVLSQHFINLIAAECSKAVTGISDDLLQAMTRYPWPGNIRELANFIERAVLMSNKEVIDDMSLMKYIEKIPGGATQENERVMTMEEFQKENILWALKESRGKVYGKGGAAEMLGITVSNLNARMKRFDIKVENYYK